MGDLWKEVWNGLEDLGSGIAGVFSGQVLPTPTLSQEDSILSTGSSDDPFAGAGAAISQTAAAAGNALQSVLPTQEEVLVWAVIAIIILLLVAYIAREVAG
jgi:hypothetical protein